MNKIFAAVSALGIVNATVPAYAQTPEINPKNLRFDSVEPIVTYRQANKVEFIEKAVFVPVVENAAKFVDKKTGQEAYMRCREALANIAAPNTYHAPKGFLKEVHKAYDALKCGDGPKI